METNQTKKRKGMMVEVYRHGVRDCTANGISKHHSRLLLVGTGVAEIFEESEDMPTVELIPAVKRGKTIHVKPLEEKRWCMFGGNFVYSSDSRFSELNNGNPIKIFDRIEN